MSELSVKTNCKEIEYIRNNILTDKKIEKMLKKKYENNPILELFRDEKMLKKKYENNPILELFGDGNRYPGYRELSLIGKWLKTLHGIQGLNRVEKDLVEAEEKYWHARLQLKIAASIERNANSKVVSLEPDIYLFSWDNVPGNGSESLLKFLEDDHGIGWTENAEIYKSDDGKTIRIFKDKNSAEITLDWKKKKATLKISDGETSELKVKKKNGKLDMYRNRKPDILANIKGNGFYIEITTKKELDAFWKYQNIDLVIQEMAKLRKLNVYVNINKLQTFPEEREIKRALEKVGLELIKGDLPIHVRENNSTIEVKEGNCPNAVTFVECKYENGGFIPSGYPRRFAEVMGNIIEHKSAQLPTNSPGFIVIESGMGFYLNAVGGSYIKVEIQNRFKRLRLFNIDAEFEGDLSNGVISRKLKDIIKTNPKGFSLSETAIVTKEKENEWVITDKEKFIFRKEDGLLKIYKISNYCSNVLGLVFIDNRRGVDEPRGYIEEANFEFIKNPYCSYNHGISTKDIVDSLTEKWHVDSACFEKYRSLFDTFYGRVFEHVLKQRYIHWQEEPRREAKRILHASARMNKEHGI
ncbi:MAG TPA: hypothetical protein HA348_00735 [Thermoplasmata archaeon]|nr:hypothetical protein [Thermoplasmata archaeon]